jgi:hypothetical protein
MGFFASSGILNRKGFFGGGFDPDASAFFATAGVTDQTARGQINAFVLGIKNLNLYNNMACWPLRSTQNAGTGMTAYSLGGLGTFDGTLTNGPTWETDGVLFNRTLATHISATRPIGTLASSAYSIFSVHVNFVEDAQYRALWIGRDASNDRMFFRTTGDAFNASNAGPAAPSLVDGTHSTVLVGQAGDTPKSVLAYKDGLVASTGSGNATGTNTIYRIGGDGTLNTRSFGFPIAFNGAFNLALSAVQILEIHTLYKNTLGAGLGLP